MENPRGAADTAAMVAAEVRRDREGNPENPEGGSSLTGGFPKDSTHMAGLEPAHQVVSRPPNKEFLREGFDAGHGSKIWVGGGTQEMEHSEEPPKLMRGMEGKGVSVEGQKTVGG